MVKESGVGGQAARGRETATRASASSALTPRCPRSQRSLAASLDSQQLQRHLYNRLRLRTNPPRRAAADFHPHSSSHLSRRLSPLQLHLRAREWTLRSTTALQSTRPPFQATLLAVGLAKPRVLSASLPCGSRDPQARASLLFLLSHCIPATLPWLPRRTTKLARRWRLS